MAFDLEIDVALVILPYVCQTIRNQLALAQVLQVGQFLLDQFIANVSSIKSTADESTFMFCSIFSPSGLMPRFRHHP